MAQRNLLTTVRFINYFDNHLRSSPINLGVARILLGIVAIWRTLTIVDWSVIQDWPVYAKEYHMFLVPSERMLAYLPLEKWITVFFLFLFLIGYRTKLVAFLSAFLIGHMSGILYMVNYSHESTFFSPIIVLIIIFGLFSHEDTLSVDAMRRSGRYSLEELNDRLVENKPTEYEMNALKWSLVAFGVFWFLTGMSKVLYGPLFEWITNFNLLFKHYQISQVPDDSGIRILLGDLLIESYWISVIAALGAIVLEVSVLVFVLLGFPVSIVILATMGFISIIAITMNPFFFELIVLPFAFLSWDNIYSKVVSERELDVVYDSNCYFCVRSLQIFNELDINRSLNFYPSSEAPNEYREREPNFNEAMYVFSNNQKYAGYHAFREIIRQYRVFAPVVYFMGLSPIEYIGERVYAYVADNRNRYFVCSTE
jgi:predicted DCC family thiol-disulfide oxidoreductase YuxK/uncharacterized membrane protein YphA (DoxX/SURF4 family)